MTTEAATTDPTDANEFSVCIWNLAGTKELLASGVTMMEPITGEAVAYLKGLGYKAKVDIPPLGLGGTAAGLLALYQSVRAFLPFLKVIIFVLKVIGNKYSRALLNTANNNRVKMEVSISYTSKSKAWINSWDPDHASHKLDTMVDASHFATAYLKAKYPNIIFRQSVSLKFDEKSASQVYIFEKDEDSPRNIGRYKKLFRQTTFDQYTTKTFSLSKFGLISRHDFYFDQLFTSSKKYYLLIPSMTINDARNKYDILKNRIEP